MRDRQRMQQKHRDLMSKRAIDDQQLLNLMRMSERQVYKWQQFLPKAARSRLLQAYFMVFRPD
jgi:hypothetical protein